jgi:hypothetical protein
MDLNLIKKVLEAELTDKEKEIYILEILIQDNNILQKFFTALTNQKNEKEVLISDLNLNLNRIYAGIKDPRFMKKMGKSFVLSKIEELLNQKEFITVLENNLIKKL